MVGVPTDCGHERRNARTGVVVLAHPAASQGPPVSSWKCNRVWPGVILVVLGRLRRVWPIGGQYSPDFVRAGDRLADAAKAGDWDAVWAVLDEGRQSGGPDVNQWRPGGRSWFTPLHQAAWLGAPEGVVSELLRRGAWKAIIDSGGRRPVDIARERGHQRLEQILEPAFERAGLPRDDILGSLNSQLAALIDDVARPALQTTRASVRYPDVILLFEDAGPDRIRFPIPGMAGGLSIELHHARLHVESWSRVVGGSGLYHVITRDRTVLVEEGFV